MESVAHVDEHASRVEQGTCQLHVATCSSTRQEGSIQQKRGLELSGRARRTNLLRSTEGVHNEPYMRPMTAHDTTHRELEAMLVSSTA